MFSSRLSVNGINMKIIALLMQPPADSPNEDKMQFMTVNWLFRHHLKAWQYTPTHMSTYPSCLYVHVCLY